MTGPRSFRVLHVIHALATGGAETWLMELLRLWATGGIHRMDFLATGGAPATFDAEALRLGANIHYIPYGRKHLASFTAKFRDVLRKGNYDAIHDHADYASGWHFGLGGNALPRVRIAHVHNPWLHIDANYAVSHTRRIAARVGKTLVQRYATHVCGTSGEILERYGFQLGQTSGPDVLVAHCGIDVDKFAEGDESDRASLRNEFGWPAEARVILFAGRLDRSLQFDHPQNHKNSWFALNIARTALERDSRVRLVMAGAGVMRAELERQIERWDMSGRLRIVGVRDDLPRLMRGADALLFPSRQEGLGMVAVEAQAAGLPVLTSTAVPREAIVIPDLFHAISLQQPVERWAEDLNRIMCTPRPGRDTCRKAMLASPFAIQNSSRQLLQVYSTPFR